MKDSISEQDPLKSSIFQDYNTLEWSYIPEKLHGREKELNKLLDAYKRMLQGKAVYCLLSGRKFGVGKTVLARYLGKMMEQHGEVKANIIGLYLNCVNFRSAESLLDEVIINLKGKKDNKTREEKTWMPKHWAPQKCDERIQRINEMLEKTKKSLLLIIDELHLLRPDEILFLLSLKEKMKELRVSLLFICGILYWKRFFPNPNNYFEELHKRYGEEVYNMDFGDFTPPYGETWETIEKKYLDGVVTLEFYEFSQVNKIMKYRRSLAFKKGVIDDESLSLVTQIAFKHENIRHGIDILRKAGLFAEENQISKITPDVIRDASNYVHSTFRADLIDILNVDELFVLYCIAKTLSKNNKAYILGQEAYLEYEAVCKAHSMEIQDQPLFNQHLSKLMHLNVIVSKTENKEKKPVESVELTLLDISANKLEEVLLDILMRIKTK
jgi:Cdc6-like AAA superfamily ATPase